MGQHQVIVDERRKRKRIHDREAKRVQKLARDREIKILLAMEFNYLQQLEAFAHSKSLPSTQSAQLLPNSTQSSPLLHWEQVARALEDETIRSLHENEQIKELLHKSNQRMFYFSQWVYTTSYGSSIPRVITNPQECWRNITLMANDQLRYEGMQWIIKQLYSNTERALQNAQWGHQSYSQFETNVSILEEENIFTVQVSTEVVMPVALELLTKVMWYAETTFTQYLQKSCDEASVLERYDDSMLYIHENVSTSAQEIEENCIYGKFLQPNRSVIVLRSILHDEKYPLATNKFTANTIEWIVLDRIDQQQTRCRTFYSIGHICQAKSGEFVSVDELRRAICVENGDDLLLRMQKQMKKRHFRQRQIFYQYLQYLLTLDPSTFDSISPPSSPN